MRSSLRVIALAGAASALVLHLSTMDVRTQSTSCLVSTSNGAVQGVDRGASCAFLGVPYGASTAGARRWRQDGHELVYIDLTDVFMAVELTSGRTMRPGQPRPLFSPGRLARGPGGGFGEPYYDLSPDGQTFLVNRLVHDPALEPITVA
jgi:hypothetical protein